jgi:hypothetical protein
VRAKEELPMKVTVQAYAGGIVCVSESEDRMSQIFRVLDQCVDWSKIEISMSKCAILSYVYDKNRRRTYRDDIFQFRGEAIPNLTTAESMRYLDALIVGRRTIKLKPAKFRFKEIEILLGTVMSSPLLSVQKRDAVKTFLLPSIDVLLLNGEDGRT